MISINNGSCIGCGGCASICPNQSITIKPNEEGFLSPEVNTISCIDCHLCEKVCVINNPIEKINIVEAYAAYCKNEEQRKNSSSGAVFYELAKYILDKGGAVFGAAFDEEWKVCHIKCTDLKDLQMLQTSKYVQSDTAGVFSQVKELLESDIPVMFSGTPCQCNALSLYLGKECSNLLITDIICHGVPSPLVWKKYISGFSDLLFVNFRDKTFGWKDFSLMQKSKNAQSVERFYDNAYMKFFLANYSLRPSCYQCKAKFPNKRADITIGDLWGAENIIPEMDDNKGLSLVTVNSQKGKSVFDDIKCRIEFREIDCDLAFSSNYAAQNSVEMPKDRARFFKYIQKTDNIDFNKLVKKFFKKASLPKRIINKAKKIIKKKV